MAEEVSAVRHSVTIRSNPATQLNQLHVWRSCSCVIQNDPLTSAIKCWAKCCEIDLDGGTQNSCIRSAGRQAPGPSPRQSAVGGCVPQLRSRISPRWPGALPEGRAERRAPVGSAYRYSRQAPRYRPWHSAARIAG